MRAFIFSVLFMLVAGMTFAADIDGNWAGEAKGMDGNPMKVNYTFKADGTTLTGSTKNPMDGSDMVIKDGKIEGTKFSYSIDFGGMAMKFNGEIKGDTVELKADMSGMGGGPGGAPAGQGAPEMPPTILKKVK